MDVLANDLTEFIDQEISNYLIVTNPKSSLLARNAKGRVIGLMKEKHRGIYARTFAKVLKLCTKSKKVTGTSKNTIKIPIRNFINKPQTAKVYCMDGVKRYSAQHMDAYDQELYQAFALLEQLNKDSDQSIQVVNGLEASDESATNMDIANQILKNARLPQLQRKIIEMHFLEGISLAEISKALSFSKTKIFNHKELALNKLREIQEKFIGTTHM